MLLYDYFSVDYDTKKVSIKTCNKITTNMLILNFFKVRPSPSKKIFFINFNDTSLNPSKCFLFDLESSFRSRDI